ncbi:MAG: glycosyltransferase [Roseateles sp.]|uniref:glycosyltransferase n=1 Tax=Roseateles sp. TaxID=1971397 RepID=UPI0039E8ABD1
MNSPVPRVAVPGSSGRRRVLHFVTGGFSGATQVAVDLCRASMRGGAIDPVLVLRRKRHTDLQRVQALRDEGLDVRLVPGWAHLATIWALLRLCRRLAPDVLVAHGFPEHLLGRWAGLWAGVSALVQVEHNSRERYTPWRLWQARRLAAHTARLVGVSEGVRQRLLALGMPAASTLAIPNGIELARFAAAAAQPFEAREPGVIMSARFARQKDQPTLIRAMALLRDRGLTPPLYLAGSGAPGWLRRSEALVRELGLTNVQFLGHVRDLPERLMAARIFVLSTHWEGMPLALVEGMAAGCACVTTAVPGTQGLLDGGCGVVVPEGDAAAMADALERLLREPAHAAALGRAARERAVAEFGVQHMTARYDALLLSL